MRLQRYLFRELLTAFLLIALLVTGVVFSFLLLRFLHDAMHLELTSVVEAAPYILAFSFPITLPVSFLVACLLTFGRFAEDNAKFAREWVEGGPAEIRARRLKRLTHTLEDWLGELTDAQRERIRRFNDAAPLTGALRDAERRRRQAEFLAMLRARDSGRRLAEWAAEWDRGRDPAFARANREFTDGLLAMLADVERSLSARQRAVAVARLREYARDFQLLAAAKVAQGAPRDR